MKWNNFSTQYQRWLSVAYLTTGVTLCSWMVTSGFSEGASGSEHTKLDGLAGRQEQTPEVDANQALRISDRNITTRDHVVIERLRQLDIELERNKALLRAVDDEWN